MHEIDIAIVGAGAAGLAAAAALASRPVSVLVLEARDRVGGRAHTAVLGGHPLDLGCGWLHSADRNPFVKEARRLGVALDHTEPHWTRQALNADFPPEDQAAFGRALVALEGRIEAAVRAGREGPVAMLMDPGGRWHPLLNAFSSYYNGAEFDCISIADYDAYADTGVNWRTPSGYGALIAAAGAPAPVRLSTPVTRIRRRAGRLALETPDGALEARCAIVTVPTPLIADGHLAFEPDLPLAREAAAGLPLGVADKVFLAVGEPAAFPEEGHLFGDPRRTETGSYHLRPFGRPYIEVYLGGAHARGLEGEGAGASTAFAIDELSALLGTGVRARLTPLGASAWVSDPWSLGSYSHALPGRRAARAVLAGPEDPRVIFAGEAVSPHDYSTAHGAADTGRTAAAKALALLG